MSSAGNRLSAARSEDHDYVDAFDETTLGTRAQEHVGFAGCSVEERKERVFDQIQMSIGARCWQDMADAANHVKFMVFDDEYADVLRGYVDPLKIYKGPPGSWDFVLPRRDEVFVRKRVLTQPSAPGDCFWRFCRALGLNVDTNVLGPLGLTVQERERLCAAAEGKFTVLVIRDPFALDNCRNHVQLVPGTLTTDWLPIECSSSSGDRLCMARMKVSDFLAVDSNTFVSRYHAHADPDGFGSLVGSDSRDFTGAPSLPPGPAQTGESRGRSAPASVRAESVAPGSTNVSGGVVRRQRRNVAARADYSYGGRGPPRSYSVSTGIMFNNLVEMTLDAISPAYAQEILEALFDAWALPTAQPDVMKYAEDLVFTFVIASTASDKADYNREYVVPVSGGEILVDFKVLSDMLTMKYGLTRRQFVRGLADSLRNFCRHDDNAELRARMADRAGCQLQFAALAFDGSTHCCGLGATERIFVKTLEARNLFEQSEVLANDASNKLLTGFSQRPRGMLS